MSSFVYRITHQGNYAKCRKLHNCINSILQLMYCWWKGFFLKNKLKKISNLLILGTYDQDNSNEMEQSEKQITFS